MSFTFFEAVFTVVLVLVLTGYGLALRRWALPRLSPYAGKALVALTAVTMALVLLHTLTWANNLPEFWDWFWDMNLEQSGAQTFSAVQLMVVGVALGVVGVLSTPSARAWRWWWLLPAAGVVFLSVDEYYTIHEYFNWKPIYLAGGAVVGVTSLLAFWFGYRDQPRWFIFFWVGGAVMVGGGVALEFLTETIGCDFGVFEVKGCIRYRSFEEFFEMAGATLLLVGTLDTAQRRFTRGRWWAVRRSLAGVCAAWTLWLVGVLWLLPTAEARLLATPAPVSYLDGDLTLVGYWQTPQVAHPGDTVRVLLYWRPTTPLQSHYGSSVQLLTRGEVATVAQTDKLLLEWYATDAWVPGVVVRSMVTFTLPDDLPTPASYTLMLRVWDNVVDEGTFIDAESIPVTETALPLLTEDTVLLGGVPVLSAEGEVAPAASALDYRFAEGMRLAGVDAPTEAAPGETLTLRFWWTVDSDVRADLTQFVHVVDESGALLVGVDAPPFAGTFPTSDWTVGAAFSDRWQVTLPDDAPPGTYTLYTGLYTPATVTRVPVVDAGGAAVVNDAVPLGSLSISGG